MGYYIYQHETDFRIKKENFEKALQALKDVCHEEFNKNENFDFGWVDIFKVFDSPTLGHALIEFNWNPTIGENGDIEDIEFMSEKLGSEEFLFKTLTPFVEKDSYIVIEGSESEWWKWLFDGKTLIEKPGKVVFED